MILTPRKRGRVHLGCGDRYLPGYLNVDFPAANGVASGASHPDVEADIVDLHCAPGVLGEVRLHHVFEHFERAVALALLLRWHDWLAERGKLVIETPDFERCIDGFAARSFEEKSLLLRHIFGSQEASWAHHLDGWSASRFAVVLPRLGYEQVEVAETTSDAKGLLVNVVVSARKRTMPRTERRAAALELLRASMNGINATEEVLARRWQDTFVQIDGDGGWDA